MSDTVQVVTYQSQYKEAYRDLNIQWIEKYFRVEKKDLDQLNNPQLCLDEGGEIFFVLSDGKPVGVCAMYNLGEGRYELAKMAVDPNYQGQGFSNLLMQVTEDWAREQGAKELVIFSNTVLTPAITLYKKFGYVTVPGGGFHEDYERSNIEMRKQL